MRSRCVKGSRSALRILWGAMFFVLISVRPVVGQQNEVQVSGGSSDAAQNVLLSHTVGKDGIPFPKPEESKWRPARTSGEGADAVPTKVPAPTPTPYQQPKRCTKNETKRVVYREKDTETKLYTDYLFIPEELVPTDPQEVFGVDVSLVPYGPEAGEAAKIRMEINEVPCVPYRRRLTNTTQYFDTGINALKNYDGAPGGAGKLHPLMQQKLYQNNRGAGSSRPSTRR